VIAQHPDAVTRFIKLKELYLELRGGVEGENRRPIPLTTNADVLQLATLWTRELARVKPRDAHERSDHRRWAACVEDVKQNADPHQPDAQYPKNEAFWSCMGRLAIYLQARKIVPSKWELFKEAVAETIAEVPATLGQATTAAGSAAASAGGTVADFVKKPAQAALVVLGAAILLPPIIRAVRS
jgi:hypothetical protein